jgi:hypothetical protein
MAQGFSQFATRIVCCKTPGQLSRSTVMPNPIRICPYFCFVQRRFPTTSVVEGIDILCLRGPFFLHYGLHSGPPARGGAEDLSADPWRNRLWSFNQRPAGVPAIIAPVQARIRIRLIEVVSQRVRHNSTGCRLLIWLQRGISGAGKQRPCGVLDRRGKDSQAKTGLAFFCSDGGGLQACFSA